MENSNYLQNFVKGYENEFIFDLNERKEFEYLMRLSKFFPIESYLEYLKNNRVTEEIIKFLGVYVSYEWKRSNPYYKNFDKMATLSNCYFTYEETKTFKRGKKSKAKSFVGQRTIYYRLEFDKHTESRDSNSFPIMIIRQEDIPGKKIVVPFYETLSYKQFIDKVVDVCSHWKHSCFNYHGENKRIIKGIKYHFLLLAVKHLTKFPDLIAKFFDKEDPSYIMDFEEFIDIRVKNNDLVYLDESTDPNGNSIELYKDQHTSLDILIVKCPSTKKKFILYPPDQSTEDAFKAWKSLFKGNSFSYRHGDVILKKVKSFPLNEKEEFDKNIKGKIFGGFYSESNTDIEYDKEFLFIQQS